MKNLIFTFLLLSNLVAVNSYAIATVLNGTPNKIVSSDDRPSSYIETKTGSAYWLALTQPEIKKENLEQHRAIATESN